MLKRQQGGILLMVGGLMSVINAVQTFIAGAEVSSIDLFGAASSIVYTCGAIELIFGIIALLGGSSRGTGSPTASRSWRRSYALSR